MSPFRNLVRRVERAAREGRGLRLHAEDVDRLAAILHTLDAATEAEHYDQLDAVAPRDPP